MAEPFDPDAYLAGPAKGFDPDAYLANSPPTEKSPGDKLREALLSANKMGPATAVSSGILDSATLGVTRPISSALAATVGGVTNEAPGTSWGDRYRAYRAAMEDRANQSKATMGKAGPSVEAVSSLPANYALGGGGTLQPLWKMAMQSMVPAFIERAAKTEKPENMGVEGLKGAGTAGIATGVLGAAGRSLNPAEWRGAAAEAAAARGLTPDQVRAQAQALYQQLDNAGVAYSGRQLQPITQSMNDMIARSQLRTAPGSPHEGLNDLIARLRTASGGAGATFGQLADIRSALSKYSAGNDSQLREGAGRIIGEIDRLVDSAQPFVNPQGTQVSTLWPEARNLWRSASVADDAAWIADKTGRKQAWKTGVNPDETTRGNFARLEERVSKPGNYDPYSPEERQLLSRIINGTGPQNMLSTIGNFAEKRVAPAAAGLGMGAGGLLGYSRTNDPLMALLAGTVGGAAGGAVPAAAGSVMKNQAARIGDENVNAFLRQLSTGSTAQAPYGQAMDRNDLARVLFGRDAAKMFGVETGQQ